MQAGYLSRVVQPGTFPFDLCSGGEAYALPEVGIARQARQLLA